MDFKGQLQMPLSIETDVNNEEELKIANEMLNKNPGVSREAILTYLWV